jgi:hypothetical protein
MGKAMEKKRVLQRWKTRCVVESKPQCVTAADALETAHCVGTVHGGAKNVDMLRDTRAPLPHGLRVLRDTIEIHCLIDVWCVEGHRDAYS